MEKEQNVIVTSEEQPVEQAKEAEVTRRDLPAQQEKDAIAERAVIRNRAKTKAARIASLFDADVEVPSFGAEITPQDAEVKLRELEMDPARLLSDPSEYLAQSAKALLAADQMQSQLRAEREGLEGELSRLQASYEETKTTLHYKLELEGWLRKLTSFLERRKLSQEEARLRSRIDTLQSDCDVKRAASRQLEEAEASILHRREELLRTKREQLEESVCTEAGREIQTIREAYEGWCEKLLQNGTITSEVTETYLKNVIVPLVHGREDISDGRAKKFYSTLRAFIAHRDDPDLAIQKRYRQEVNNMFESKEGFYFAQDACRQLLFGEDLELVRELVARLAVEDITPIIETVEKKMPDRQYRFSDTLRSSIGRSSALRGMPTFGDHIRFGLQPVDTRPFPNRERMNLWDSFKSSEAAQEILGDAIEKQDRVYYEKTLSGSLVDDQGTYIEMLNRYPTPDAVRNAVLIAAADAQSYRTIHANHALIEFSKRPDWNAILDRAEAAYPELRGARRLLETWDHEGSSNQPDLQSAAREFVLAVSRDERSDEKLAALAVQALPNEAMLDVLQERKELPKAQAETIKEALAFIDTWNKEAKRDAIARTSRAGDLYLIFTFQRELRENLFNIIKGRRTQEQEATTKTFEVLARQILTKKEDPRGLRYITSGSVMNRLLDQPPLDAEQIKIFLEAYKRCPTLATSIELQEEFCKQFKGEDDVAFFSDVVRAYGDSANQLVVVAGFVREGRLSRARALELPVKAGDVLKLDTFPSFIAKLPELFLGTDEGLEFSRKVISEGLDFENGVTDTTLGATLSELLRRGFPHQDILPSIFGSVVAKRADTRLSSNDTVEVAGKNWRELLVTYVSHRAETIAPLSEKSKDVIEGLFKTSSAKDFCLERLQEEWLRYLKSGNAEQLPFRLYLIADIIQNSEGAGNMSQIESFAEFMGAYAAARVRKTTGERTQQELFDGCRRMEERFVKERWSNEDRAEYYMISSDILKAAPSLFSDYLELFDVLSPSELKRFGKELYPLYRARLALAEKTAREEKSGHEKGQLVHLRHDIKDFTGAIVAGEKPFETQRTKLVAEIAELFKSRFGIVRVPETFVADHTRALTNVSMYLANLNARDATKEAVLGFYLSLMVNDRWDDYRRGESIDPAEYLTSEKSNAIRNLLQKQRAENPLTAERLGIRPEDMPEFMKVLQQETQSAAMGDIETVDVKLGNILLNLEGLADLDLYPLPLDKRRMQLLLSFGNKKIGAVVAKTFRALSHPERPIQFSEGEAKARGDIEKTLVESGIERTPATLKKYLQDEMKPFATVVNLLQFANETGAKTRIDHLRKLLEPSPQVIEIFNRLGEEFKPASGAFALSQDLNYLDNMIAKREGELTVDEKTLLLEYTGKIREEVIQLQAIHDQIKAKFEGLSHGGIATENQLLKDKIDQIVHVVNAQARAQGITSTTTNHLNTIIENIRECLSCTKSGINNDTNLTFGDTNKFYVYSQSETQTKGSIADQILFLEPVAHEDGTRDMSFVFDRMYGTNTPFVLMNQIEAVARKYHAVKKKFPHAKLSMFVTDAAIASGGLSEDLLQKRLEERFGGKTHIVAEEAEVDVVRSAMADHYIEFSGGSRTPGARKVRGITIRL